MPTDEMDYQQRAGALLRAKRDALGLSTGEAARRITAETEGPRIARQTLASYEAGQRRFGLNTLRRIATAYGCSPRDLVPADNVAAETFQDITVRVLVGGGTDQDALEHALVRAAEGAAQGGRIVATSAPFLPAEGS